MSIGGDASIAVAAIGLARCRNFAGVVALLWIVSE
jgi:hypothetical protein